MLSNFAAFILTHGRPNNVKTYDTLKKFGYTGRVIIVIDNEDTTANEYKDKYGDLVIEFDKVEAEKITDKGDNFDNRKGVVFARNMVYDIAAGMNLNCFIVLDDDYSGFYYKFDAAGNYKESPVKNLDRIFAATVEYYLATGAESVAYAQNGDFIGGKKSDTAIKKKLKRKVMQTFFCSNERRMDFVGRINEDVNMYVSRGMTGSVFLTIPQISVIQRTTQKNKGGLTDMYVDVGGTYVKSFYSVMYCPSCVKVTLMGDKHKRIHHHISWNNAVPVILHESFKKK